MEPDQDHESAGDASGASSTERDVAHHPLISRVAKLMGKTAGLARTAGVKVADGLFAAGGQAAKLLSVPAKVRSFVAHKTRQKRAELSRESADLRCRITELYTRIGKRACDSPQIDPSLLLWDPQLEALMSAVQDLEAERRKHEQHAQGDPAAPAAPECKESGCTVEQTAVRSADAQAGESFPAPAGQERPDPPAGPA